MAKIDLGRTVDYILNHYKDLRKTLSKNELNELQQMLELASIQVESKIIESTLNKDSDISEEMEETKKHIEGRLADLEKQKAEKEAESKYPEFKADVRDESVPDSYQQEVEDKKREKYIDNKKTWETEELPKIESEISELQRQISELTVLQQQIGNPEEFVKKFVENRYSKASQTKMKELCDFCATTMANGYMTMEKSPIDGEPLFTHIGTSNFKGYVPDFKRVESFIKVIRDPNLCHELDDYGSSNLSVSEQEEEVDKAHDLVTYYDSVSTALDKDMVRSEVEKDITRLAELKKSQSEINSKKFALTEKPKGIMGYIRNWLNRRGNQQKLDEINEQESKITGELDKLYGKGIPAKIKDNADYALIYDFYMGKDRVEENYIGFDDKMPEDLERAVQLVEEGKKYGMKKYAELSGKLAVKKSNAKSGYDLENDTLSDLKRERTKKYDALSPDGKAIIDNNRNYSSTDLTKKYVNVRGAERLQNSPLVASLVLEGVMRARNIETPEDAEKMGLTLSDEQMGQIKANGGKLKGDLVSWLQGIRDRDEVR